MSRVIVVIAAITVIFFLILIPEFFKVESSPMVATSKPFEVEMQQVVLPAVVIPEIEIETPQVELSVVTPDEKLQYVVPSVTTLKTEVETQQVELPVVEPEPIEALPEEIPVEEPTEELSPAVELPTIQPPTAEELVPLLLPTPPPQTIDEPAAVMPAAVEVQKRAISSFPYVEMMCLTFDDGWGKRNIERILNALRRHNVRATLFVIGHRVKAYPDLWKKAISDGHEIAYHSMDHKWKTGFSNERIVADIERWETIAREVLGEDYVIPKIARLPGGAGHRSARVLGVFNNLGYTVVGWCTDTLTGVEVRTAENKAAHVLARARPGAIILQHFNELDARATELYIDRLVAKGIPFGLVSEALTENKANRPN